MSVSVLVGLKEAKGALRIWAEDGNLDNNDQQRVVPLARVLASWFVECDNCNAEGWVWKGLCRISGIHASTQCGTPHGTKDCPECGGRGFRWTPETIERGMEVESLQGFTERSQRLITEEVLWSLFTQEDE